MGPWRGGLAVLVLTRLAALGSVTAFGSVALGSVAALGSLAALGTLARADVPVPPLTGRVVDLTGTLSGGAVNRIESELAQLEAQKGSQIAVLIVPTTQPEEIEQFATRVEDQWKLGRKGVDDCALLIVAKNDRRARIEVCYGLEGALPDALANRIVDETITPRFKQGDFDGGVEAGVKQMISVVNGEPLPAPDRHWESRRGGLHEVLPLLLLATFVAGGVLRSIFGRALGSVLTGGAVGAIAWLLTHFVPIGVGAGLLAFLFALLSGGAAGWTNGAGGWRGGGFGGGLGGFGGGGGGGGFSGGGGRSGGGGASGSW
jgi:uncharacterized protein